MGLDTLRSRATPEGVTLNLRVAGPPVRLIAWGIDAVVMLIVQGLLGFVAALFGAAGQGFLLLAVFAVIWFYPVAFELLRHGATPGKASMGLRVVHDDGTPVGPVASVVRNFLRVADFLPFAYGAGLGTMLLNRNFQRLGDLAAGTLVVYRETEAADLDVPTAPPMPPPTALDRDEQRAIIDFASRRSTWSTERSDELAEILSPLTGAQRGDRAAQLDGMANWLLGRRSEP